MTLVLAVICIMAAANFISPMHLFAEQTLGLGERSATTVVSVAFAGLLGGTYLLMRRLLESMFTREEQQSRLVKNFSAEVSQSLSTADIMVKRDR